MNRRQFMGANMTVAMNTVMNGVPVQAETIAGKKIREPQRDIDILDKADIVILGGGPAGCAAATAAGRLGADVLLVERYGSLGGMSTEGLVILIGEYDRRLTGLPKEYVDAFLASGEARFNEYENRRVPDEPIGNPEIYKHIYYEMAAEVGTRFLFHAWAVSGQVSNGMVDGVIIESKSGRQAITGRIIIDCTGDADTAPWAGVPFNHAKYSYALGLDELLMDVDFDKYLHFRKYNPDEWKRIMDQARKMNFGWAPWQTWRNDLAWINTSYGDDALDVKNLTACEIDLRKRLKQHWLFFRENMPGFENSHIMRTANQIGVRGSRSIVGDHMITKQDLEADRFPDVIGRNIVFTGKNLIGLPYRALVPKTVDNLLYAGRCISVTKDAQDLIRGITACWIYGQAAGAAAVLCLQNGVMPRKLDTAALQKTLRDQGVDI